MRDLALRRGLLLLGLAAYPLACTESDGSLVPANVVDDAGGAPSPPDAEPPARDSSDGDAEPPPPTCSDGGFCRTELPTSEILYSLWGAPDGSLWAGGSRSIFHFDGVAWQTAFTWPETGVPAIRAKILVGTGSEDVWAFGDGAEFDPDGSPHAAVAHLARRGSELAWRAVTTDLEVQFGAAGTAWMASPTDLWVAWGYQGVWHVHGEDENGHVAAERELAGDGRPLLYFPTGVWGFGADRVFVSGYDGNEVPVLLRRTVDGSWITAADLATAGAPLALSGTRAGEARLWTFNGWTLTIRGLDDEGVLLAPELQSNGVSTCRPTVVSAMRSDLAWLSDGATVCRYESDHFQIIPITIGSYPRFKVNAVWSNGNDTWIVGEERPRVNGALGRGFALRRGGGP